jgi:hypothetical protein
VVRFERESEKLNLDQPESRVDEMMLTMCAHRQDLRTQGVQKLGLAYVVPGVFSQEEHHATEKIEVCFTSPQLNIGLESCKPLLKLVQVDHAI